MVAIWGLALACTGGGAGTFFPSINIAQFIAWAQFYVVIVNILWLLVLLYMLMTIFDDVHLRIGIITYD